MRTDQRLLTTDLIAQSPLDLRPKDLGSDIRPDSGPILERDCSPTAHLRIETIDLALKQPNALPAMVHDLDTRLDELLVPWIETTCHASRGRYLQQVVAATENLTIAIERRPVCRIQLR